MKIYIRGIKGVRIYKEEARHGVLILRVSNQEAKIKLSKNTEYAYAELRDLSGLLKSKLKAVLCKSLF